MWNVFPAFTGTANVLFPPRENAGIRFLPAWMRGNGRKKSEYGGVILWAGVVILKVRKGGRCFEFFSIF